MLSDGSSASFQCPQQKDLLLAPSRLNDGICDCCDGSDERSGDCVDICDVVLAEERAQREKLKVAFSYGYEIRQKDVKDFQTMKDKTLELIDSLINDQIPPFKSKILELEGQVKDTQLSYVLTRFQKMSDIFSKLKLPGNLEQLQTLIASVCHMSGEINHKIEPKVDDKNTCVPLRRAGLDLGIMWEKENLETKTVNVRLGAEKNDQLALEIVDIFYNNYISDGEDSVEKNYKTQHNDSWESRKSNDYRENKRHNQDYDAYDEEDIMNEIHGMDDQMPDSSEKYTFSSPISIWRQNFYQYAVDMLEKINAVLNLDTNDEIEANETVDSDNTDTEDKSFDPMAMQMLQVFLERRISYIDTGETFALSAIVLMNSLSNLSEISAEKWMQLAAGTIFYSNLSVTDIAEIVTLYDIEESDSCISPYTSMCPPEQIQMKSLDDTVVTFPSNEALSLISKRCTLRQGNEHKCDVDIESDELPSIVPEGYFDYYAVFPRDDDDPYSKLFSQVDDDDNALLTLKDLTQSLDDANEKLTELENEVQNLEDSIGGDDDTFYGIDGELYSLKDECYEINAGKYTYELCMFGKAQQKEGSSSSGTSLGNWKESSSLEESGERVFQWTGGTKCWNGPNRSATAYVICGAETKILSAEEPNICQYEFDMESPVACDDTFSRIYDL